MSDRENSEMEIEEDKETDRRTESTSMEETEGQDKDLRTSESDARTDWRYERDPRLSGEKRSSGHPVRTGIADCRYYLKNGSCFFGRSCRFNHPPLPQRNQMGDDTVQPSAYQVRLGARDCEQYLQTGQCSYGSKCWFNHPRLPERNLMRHEMVQPSPYPGARDWKFTHSVRGDGVEPMRRATTWVRRSYEMRHGTESSSRARTILDSPEHDPRERFQDVSDDVMAGQNSWLQRRQAHKNVQRGNIDRGQRRESKEERTPRECQAHDLEEQKQRKRKEETLRIDKIKATVQSDEGGIQTEQRLEIPENLQEQADMERKNREAQEKAQEERSRLLTDNVDQFGQFLQGIGTEWKEGDGF